jgi:cation diffusion facilitator CzcD-associated flavoprotein CzcO
LANFRDIFMDEEANAEFSEFIAEKIRSRVNDPEVAEKLIPKDHGFGVQRVPLETGYYEAYNRANVHLVDLQETPIERITTTGIRTTDRDYEFDIIVYATGFDAVTGAYDRIDIRGVGGLPLREKWRHGPVTYFGMQASGFPNMIMPTGPQSASASTNFPRGIELGVNWATELLQYMWKNGYTREEATPEAEAEWSAHVADLYGIMLMRKAQGWFTGYNSNVDGHERGTIRYLVYNGGTPKFRARITEAADRGYAGIELR